MTSISNNAFEGCTRLTSVTIGNGVTSIGNSAFDGCSTLTSVTIPNSVTSIGNNAFLNCNSLTSVAIECPSIGSWFSGLSSIKNITLGEKVTSIGWYAFKNCSGLTSINIPNSVTSIGEQAFEGCTSLTKVIVPDIAAWCGISFYNAPPSFNTNSYSNPLIYAKHIFSDEETEITDLVIPDGVTSIALGAFMNCTSLTSVSIPNSVTNISSYAFCSCTSLTDVYCLAESVPQASGYYYGYTYDVFYNSSIQSATLHVPASALNAYKNASPWKNFNTIVAI